MPVEGWVESDIQAVMAKRLEILDKANRSKELQAVILEKCRRDVVFWCNNWVWTYDPRRKPSYIPFILFPRQEEYLRWREECYQNKQRGLTEKSRDMGVTWLNVVWQMHKWLFEPGFKGTFGSRKLELVDRKGDPDSIFEKMRMILDRMPSWMAPRGFKKLDHDNHLRLINPANGATITGEGGDNMGRGGRSSVYDVDEAAFLENPQSVEAAISNNTEVIFETSTPNGEDNPFAMRRFSGKVPVFTLHWKDDPRKDGAWYKRMVDSLDPVTVAQEIDIDYGASKDGVVIQKGWVDAAKGRPLGLSEVGAISIGGDIARYGRDKSAAVVREGGNILHVEEWQGAELDESAGHFIRLGCEYESHLEPYGSLYFFIDGIGVGAGIIPMLRRYIEEKRKTNWHVLEVNVAEVSPDDKTKRMRDYLWWRTRRFFEREEPAISRDIKRDLVDRLATELSGPSYKVMADGRIQVESKDDMKRRGVASPNLADALIHTFAVEYEKVQPKKARRGAWAYDDEPAAQDWMTT